MGMNTRFSIHFHLLFACFLAANLHAEVKLPAIFGDHMVLQRGRPIVVFGHAQPAEAVGADALMGTFTSERCCQ